MEAFDQAKQQADYELSRVGLAREKMCMEDEINLEGHRPRVRRYAHELRNLIRIGQGPETLLCKKSSSSIDRSNDYLEAEGDAVEAYKWKCVWTLRGIRIFEDVSDSKNGKYVLVKSVGVIDASADAVFEVLSSLEPSRRYEWDVLTGDLELIESLNGHYDVLYGTYDTKYFTWRKSKRDFVFSRQWFRAQDGTYTILHFPSAHKKRSPRSGYQRSKITPSTWEIKSLTAQSVQSSKCILTHMLEVKFSSWCKWKKNRNSKFEASVPFSLLCQVAGLKEYIAANPSLAHKSDCTVVDSEGYFSSFTDHEFDDSSTTHEFYDAITAESSSDSDDTDEEIELDKQDQKVNPTSVEGLELDKLSDPSLNEKLDSATLPHIDPKQFHGSLQQGQDGNDKNCWSDPGGMGFMVRGKTYLKDNNKVKGGDPLLKLVAIDWLKSKNSLDKVGLRPSCMVQSESGRKLPFILVFNLQIPAKPNYSMVMYYASDRPVQKDSLLEKFVTGTDTFRDSRLKLIPSIIKGYWMVKRAVGTKSCLLGKAVTCRYLRQDNFLEIDVDVGSSSVARGVTNLVVGYITSLVVDIAILVEAKEENELPEYVVGTARLNCIRLDSAEQV